MNIKENTVSIGYYREDGDFAILATFNNNDEHLSRSELNEVCGFMCDYLNMHTDESIVILERQDAPDYVDVEPAPFSQW
jgi:hypothetical protein